MCVYLVNGASSHVCAAVSLLQNIHIWIFFYQYVWWHFCVVSLCADEYLLVSTSVSQVLCVSTLTPSL